MLRNSGDDEFRRLERAVTTGGGYEAALRLVAAYERRMQRGEPRVVLASRAVLRDNYWSMIHDLADVLGTLPPEATSVLLGRIFGSHGWVPLADEFEVLLEALPSCDPRETLCFGCGTDQLSEGGSLFGRAEKVFLYDTCCESLRRFRSPESPELGSRWRLTKRYSTGNSLFEAGDLATVVSFIQADDDSPLAVVRFDADFDPDDARTEGNFPMTLEVFHESFEAEVK